MPHDVTDQKSSIKNAALKKFKVVQTAIPYPNTLDLLRNNNAITNASGRIVRLRNSGIPNAELGGIREAKRSIGRSR